MASAQTLYAGAGLVVNGALGADLRLRLEGYRPPGAGSATVTFEVAGPRPRLGLGVSTNQAFGPLGNLIIEGWGAVAPHPAGGAAAEASLAARGVIGP
ncbi:MAG: hypothetical protein WDA15_09105, partial [Trueperaceae bacterium]